MAPYNKSPYYGFLHHFVPSLETRENCSRLIYYDFTRWKRMHVTKKKKARLPKCNGTEPLSLSLFYLEVGSHKYKEALV